jgi:hypothetical protein
VSQNGKLPLDITITEAVRTVRRLMLYLRDRNRERQGRAMSSEEKMLTLAGELIDQHQPVYNERYLRRRRPTG